MDRAKIPFKEMTEKKLKTVLKFDSGADGFQFMIYVLAFFAVLTLVLGITFIVRNF